MHFVGDTLIKWGLVPRRMRSTSAVSGRRTGKMEEVSVMRPRKRDNSEAGAGRTPVGLGPREGRLNRIERQSRSLGFAQKRVMRSALRDAIAAAGQKERKVLCNG